MAKLSIRVDLAGGARLGPGKVRLLEAVAEAGSISGGGRSLGMSYRRAWSLVADLNTAFGRPVVASSIGGKQGGGAVLTELGREVVATYRRIEAAAAEAAHDRLERLEAVRLEEEHGPAIPHGE